MRKYTKEEERLIRRRIRDAESGKCYCFVLGRALADNRVSRGVYEAVRQLEERCPLHVSGQCLLCRERLDAGCIDLFQAARDLGVRCL